MDENRSARISAPEINSKSQHNKRNTIHPHHVSRSSPDRNRTTLLTILLTTRTLPTPLHILSTRLAIQETGFLDRAAHLMRLVSMLRRQKRDT